METVTNIYGEESTVQVPRMQRRNCIGCGTCETKCPVYGEAAIRVYTSDETGQSGGGNGQQRRGNR
jgi:ferredoxin